MRGWVSFVLCAGCTAQVLAPSDDPAPAKGEELPIEEDSGTPTDSGGSTVPDPDPADLPSAYTYPGTVSEGTPKGVPEIAAAIDEAIAGSFAFNSQPAMDAYTQAMAAARGDCPTQDRDADSQFWTGYCETADGSVFQGFMTLQQTRTVNSPTDSFSGNVLIGDASIHTSGGYSFTALATMTNWRKVDVQGGHSFTNWSSMVSGIVMWDGPGVDGTWVADGLMPATRFSVSEWDNGAREAHLAGTVPLVDAEFGAVAYGDLSMYDDLGGADCALEPEGMLSIRDADGYWYDLSFEGGYELEDTSGCDGCGTVTWRGQPLGEICPDFSPWMGWSADPW